MDQNLPQMPPVQNSPVISPQMPQVEKKRNTKKIILTLVIVLVILAVLSLGFFLMNHSSQKKGSASLTPGANPNGQSGKTGSSTTGGKWTNIYNPVISQQEIDRVQNGYKQKYQEAGKPYPTQPNQKFHYTVSSKLQSSLLNMFNAYAADGCNATTGGNATIYILKKNLSDGDARQSAALYSLTGNPQSLPMDDGVSFRFFFTNTDDSSYFTIDQPSGAYNYHHAFKDMATGPDNGRPQDMQIAEGELKRVGLFDNTTLSNELFSEHMYMFTYKKTYAGFPLVTTDSIGQLGASTSVCAVTGSTSMGVMTAMVTMNGRIEKIINDTRTVSETKSVKKLSLSESVNTYGQPIIPPIVIGSATAAQTTSATIDEAQLVVYDYGENYAQDRYVPMYLTSGKATSGARVLSIFPAVGKDDLQAVGEKVDINPNASTTPGDSKGLTVAYFTPAPTPTPEPTTPPVVHSKAATGGLCYGRQVDYVVSCSVGGQTVCDRIGSGATDPYGVCSSGCQTKSGTITVSSAESACDEYMNQSGIKIDGGFSGGGGIIPGLGAGAGGGANDNKSFYVPQGGSGTTAVCQVQGCPC